MTRFTFSSDHTWGDGDGPRSVTIATENLEGFEKYKAKMGAAVREAVLRLGNAYKNTNTQPDADVVDALRKYFLLTPPFDSNDIAKIKLVMLQTSLGLKTGAIQLKVHDATPMNKPDAIGYVKMRPHGLIKKSNAKTNYSYPTWKEDKTERRVGAMHFKGSALSMGRKNDVATRLVIHEATHKHAGTLDYHYFTTLEGTRSADPFTDKDKALENADSYAWFVWDVGDPDVTLDYFEG